MIKAARRCNIFGEKCQKVIRQLVRSSHRQRGFYRERQCSVWTVREQSKCRTTDPFIPGELVERVHLPAARVGGTRWGNEYSFCAGCFLHISQAAADWHQHQHLVCGSSHIASPVDPQSMCRYRWRPGTPSASGCPPGTFSLHHSTWIHVVHT